MVGAAIVRALQAQGQSPDAVNDNLQQLATQTQQTLQNYLGQERFNKLQGNGMRTKAALKHAASSFERDTSQRARPSPAPALGPNGTARE